MHTGGVIPARTLIAGASWRKSSRSGGYQNCVEVAAVADSVAVRDSKHPAGPEFVFRAGTWATFVREIQAGKLAQL